MSKKPSYEELQQRVEELEKVIDQQEWRSEEIREALKRYCAVFDTAKDAIFVADETGRFVDVNRAACESLGYSKEELLKLSLTEIDADPRGYEAFLKVRDGLSERVTFQVDQQTKEGTLRPVEITGSFFRSKTQQMAVAIARDITERKRAEEQLEVYANELERKNQELKQLIYIISHDLQEPLAMLSSCTNLLARRYMGKIDSDADKWFNYVATESNRVQRLSRTLLKRSRMSQFGRNVQPTDVKAVFERTLASLTMVIADTGAQVTHDPLPTVMADEIEMEEVFQNLIRNSLKFRSEAAPHIHVSAERNETEWVFSVQDNGVGIDPEFAKRIFSVFDRIPTQGEHPDAGIGLAICRKIVEDHGGRIWVESEPGRGSTFYFAIPSAGE